VAVVLAVAEQVLQLVQLELVAEVVVAPCGL
jgi:hypothetical protein